MPIPFSCPHCGAFTEVDDVYAGHSGPCATCGKPITIPFAPAVQGARGGAAATATAAAPAKTRSGMVLLLLAIAGCVAAVVLLVALGLALLRPAVQAARGVAWQSQCAGNLELIGLALQQYHADHNTYPPAYVPDADGKPMHSWRVLILPYLGDQAAAVYHQYDFNKPWDSPENLRLAGFMPDAYACPEHPEARAAGETTYMVIVGQNTMFPGERSVSGNQIFDPLQETIMVVETPQSGVNWMKPQDLDATRTSFEINGREETDPGSYHQHGGAHVLTADGKVHFLSDDFPSSYITSMSTINGGDPVPQNMLK